MLRLTLSTEEYLMLGDDIKIVFLGGSNNHLRIMVDAPKEVDIVRSKVLEKAHPEIRNGRNITPNRNFRNAIARKRARQNNSIIIDACVPAGGPKAGTGAGYYK